MRGPVAALAVVAAVRYAAAVRSEADEEVDAEFLGGRHAGLAGTGEAGGVGGGQAAALFKTCKKAREDEPVADAVATHLESTGSGSIDFGDGKTVSSLECSGAGGNGIAYTGQLDGTPVVVKFRFQPSECKACKWAQLIQQHADPSLTGSQYFVKAFAWGTWTVEHKGSALAVSFEIWEKVDGVDLQVLLGEVTHMQKDGFEKVNADLVRYLPKKLGGQAVLVKKSGRRWEAEKGGTKFPGIAYRKSKSPTDKDQDLPMVKWGDKVSGTEDGEWLRVEVKDTFDHWVKPKRGFKAFFGGAYADEEAAALECARQAMEAMIFLWGLGLRHSDIQRSNLMWGAGGQLKVVDYDLMQFVPDLPSKYDEDASASVKQLFVEEGWSVIPTGAKLGQVRATFVSDAEALSKDLQAFKGFYQRAFNAEPVVRERPLTPEEYAAVFGG